MSTKDNQEVAEILAASIDETIGRTSAYRNQEAQRLAVAQNIVTNGRWFCAAIVAINLASDNHLLAVLAAAPIGLSVLTDAMPGGHWREAAALTVYAWAISVASFTFINLW